jgi:MerR family transcriptional regulator, light-induced transcriptional regulator
MSEIIEKENSVPVYNIKAISIMVGLLPVTLRAWERRYSFLHPVRGNQGYRMYSEYDLLTLRWVKQQIESGMSVSRAVEHLNDMRQKGLDPVKNHKIELADNSMAFETLTRQLYDSVTAFNSVLASEILRRAFAIYTVDEVLTLIVKPTLVEIGKAWKRGDLPVACEHFASQFFMQRLISMLASSMPPSHEPVIIAAGAPGEEHQIGLLMIVVMLRWRGWDIRYLGSNMSLEKLPEALGLMNPRMLLFSATTAETARAVLKIEPEMKRFGEHRPQLVFGGQGFLNQDIPASLKTVWLDGTPEEIVSTLERMLE